jgi:hypothetical protein
MKTMTDKERLLKAYKMLATITQPLCELKETRNIFPSIDDLEAVVGKIISGQSSAEIFFKIKEDQKLTVYAMLPTVPSLELVIKLPGSFDYKFTYFNGRFEYRLELVSKYSSDYILILEGNSEKNEINYSWKGGITFVHDITPEIMKELSELQGKKVEILK